MLSSAGEWQRLDFRDFVNILNKVPLRYGVTGENFMAAPGTLVGFIPTRDGDAARDFYENKVGLHFISEDQFAIVFQSGENMIRLARTGSFTPAPFTILGWLTSHIERDVRGMSARGVKFERYDYMGPQDELGIWTTPGGDKVAWFKDPDGNTLSIAQKFSV
jgi:catechol 2,3-dioxygenase-like lactoylglutathione lyase family enzyme